jgi:SAM-dependent methyltransferase
VNSSSARSERDPGAVIVAQETAERIDAKVAVIKSAVVDAGHRHLDQGAARCRARPLPHEPGPAATAGLSAALVPQEHGQHEGSCLIERSLRAWVRFGQINLDVPLPDVGRFALVFLRNVMIYFSDDTKRQVVARVIAALHDGGHFLIGHSESLNGLTDAVVPVAPSVYRKSP